MIDAPPGRRERNKLEKRNRIVKAARALFRRQGFEDTSTQQIAAAADIGAGTLFLYARSKEDLLIMVFKDEMMETVRKIFAHDPPGVNLLERLMSAFDKMMAYHARDTTLSRFLLKELVMPSSPEQRSDISDLMDAIYAGLSDILRSAGPDLVDQPELVARSAFALYYFALVRWLGFGFELDQCRTMLERELESLLNLRPAT